MTQIISFADGAAHLNWLDLVQALKDGHQRPKAQTKDMFLYRGADTVLTRSAWIDGMGMFTKSATVFAGNPAKGKPLIGGGALLFDDADGGLSAVIDFHLITKWKTAGDSLLAALLLAPATVQDILIVGAGTVGGALVEAFRAGYPKAHLTLWNRNPAKAHALARQKDTAVADDLEAAVQQADIILTCTTAKDPVIKGDWLRPGQHLNMIGAYRPDMREGDDTALQKSRIYVDSFETTLDHIGEMKIPLDTGAITRAQVLADFYQMDQFQRTDGDITVFKNGGGAHLDLMTACYILDAVRGGCGLEVG